MLKKPSDLLNLDYQSRQLSILLAACLALLALPILVTGGRSLSWPILHDAPLMHYIAWRIQSGAVPYRDLFDQNMPGIYLLHLLVYKLFQDSDLAWRLIDLCCAALTMIVMAWYCRPFGRWAMAFAPLLFFGYHLYLGPRQVGQRDFFILPLVLLSALGINRFLEQRRTTLPLILSGLVFGLALSIKPHLALLGVIFGLMLAAWTRKAPRVLIKSWLAFGLSALVIPLLMGWWLWRIGAWHSFVDIVSNYLLPFYSKLHQDSRGVIADRFVKSTCMFYVMLPLLPLLVPGRQILEPRRLMLLAGTFYGFINYFLQNKGFIYHLYPLFLFLCPLSVMGLKQGFTDTRREVRIATLIGLFMLSSLMGFFCWQSRSLLGSLQPQRDRVQNLVRDLSALGKPGQTVQVMDTTSGGIEALLRLHLRQPTRFIYDFYFFYDTEDPRIKKLRAEFMRGFEHQPRPLLVVMEDSWVHSGYDRLNLFPELVYLIDNTYTLALEREGYRIYAPR